MAEVFNMELRDGGDVEEELSDEESPMPVAHYQVGKGRLFVACFTNDRTKRPLIYCLLATYFTTNINFSFAN